MDEKQKEPLTLEKQLASFVEIDQAYRHLWNAWETARDDLARILSNIAFIFPHYSQHNASHAETIIHRVEAVLGEDRIAKLHATEIWLFLMSAYTHDLGMLAEDKEVRKLWKSEKFLEYLQSLKGKDLEPYADIVLQNDKRKDMPADWPVSLKWAVIILTAEYYRKHHAERSEEMIQTPQKNREVFSFDFTFQGFMQERFIILLGKVAGLHGKDFKDIFSLPYTCSGMGLADDLVYPRRVAAMLRLGDLLDMDNGRFDKNSFPIIGEVPETTMYHRRKEASLRHFLVTRNCIEAAFDCPDEGAYEAASGWMGWLKQETENLALHWNEIVSVDFGSAPVLKSAVMTLNGQTLKGDALKQFDFEGDAVFELLEGANIYRNQFACLRELLQNAEDATKLRFWEDLESREVKVGNNASAKTLIPFDIPDDVLRRYTIDITLEYIPVQDKSKVENKRVSASVKEGVYKVTVKDHGIGITNARLEQMGKVADSWHEQKDTKAHYKGMPGWLSPTGTFGLGLQSVFRLTDTLYCITVPCREKPKKIIFRSRQKGGRISSQKLPDDWRYPVGTSFYFDIPQDKFKHFSYQIDREYSQALDSFDPFNLQNEDAAGTINLYYLLECLTRDTGVGLFPVNVTLKCRNPIYRKQLPKISHKNINGYVYEPGHNLQWAFNWEQGEVIAYNQKDCITYDFFLGFHSRYQSNVRFSFKGMHVKDSPLDNFLGDPYSRNIHGNISIDGLPTREYLTLNREEIRSEKLEKLGACLREDTLLILKWVLGELVGSKAEMGSKLSPNAWLSLAVLTEALMFCGAGYEPDVFVPEEKKESIVKKARLVIAEQLKGLRIGAVQVDKSGQQQDIHISMPLDQFFKEKWEGNSFWVYELGDRYKNFLRREPYEKPLAEFFQREVFPAQAPAVKELFAVSIDNIRRLFSSWALRILEIYEDSRGTGIKAYKMQIRNTSDFTMADVPLMSKTTQERLNISLLQYPRMVTCASQAYKSLAVQTVPNALLYSVRHRLSFYPGIYPEAITPFNENDLKNIPKTGFDEEAYWKEIENREDFNALVRYVKEHNVDTTVNENEIRDAYRNWALAIVKDYQNTDLMKKKKETGETENNG